VIECHRLLAHTNMRLPTLRLSSGFHVASPMYYLPPERSSHRQLPSSSQPEWVSLPTLARCFCMNHCNCNGGAQATDFVKRNDAGSMPRCWR
jgi:hypothetical protein